MKDMIDPDPNLRPEPLVDDVDRALRPQNLNDFTEHCYYLMLHESDVM